MKKILVIEDDKYITHAYQSKLTKEGYDIRTALDGEEAETILNSFSPDIIILDLVLPKKDGFEVLQDLQSNDKWKSIPVIIVSNLGQKEDIEKGLKLGARDYIAKTELTLNKLIDKIQSIIG